MLFIQHSFFAQNCTNHITGYVLDEGTNTPMVGATITLKETKQVTISDDKGYFEINNICKGFKHLNISHLGCEDQNRSIQIGVTKNIFVFMPHFVDMLDGVHLLSKNQSETTQTRQVVNIRKIQQNANQNLANQLQDLVGVTTIKTGNSIAVPVVHGLHGSRLTILNNGIVQAGQQWSDDHAPEIDPLVASSLVVTKGVGALEYQGSGLGVAINVKPKSIRKDPHLHGTALYFSETNGRGNNLNLSLEQTNQHFGWRATGTLKKYGDQQTANLHLNNTGFTEANLALQLEKKISEKWYSKFYVSTFNTTLGILKGSIVTLNGDNDGDGLSDYAQFIINADVPQFTEPNFSYGIDSPKQEVNHHLLKWENTVNKNENENFTFTYAGQINNRKEFDVRRGGRSSVPALSLYQYTHFLEAKRQKYYDNDLESKQGLQYTFTDNTNNPETGILPLIPDYLSHQIGGFILLDKDINNWKLEIGTRYNFTYQSVAYINRDAQRSIQKFTNLFHNYSVVTGASYHTKKDFHWSLNLGYSSRNPDINELYAYGLRQGTASWEIGNPNLKRETGVKATFGLEGNVKQKWFFETLAHTHYIHNYVYLNVDNEFTTTIRGTFPQKSYRQAEDATILGFDFGTKYIFSDQLKLGAKYSFILGENLSQNIPLPLIPPNDAMLSLDYSGFKQGYFINTVLSLKYRYVWKQNNILPNQLIGEKNPPGYQLFDLNLNSEFYINQTKINTYAKMTNIFNISYRDYLSGLLPFADDLGRSFTIGFKVNI